MGRPPKTDDTVAEQVEAEAERLEKAINRRNRLKAKLESLDDSTVIENGPAPLPGLERADTIVTDLAGDGSFEIYRLDAGQPVRVGVYDLTAWPMAMESCVREKGGGDYLIIFRRTDGSQAGRVTRTFDKTSYPGVIAAKPAPAGAADELFLKFLEVQDRRETAYRAELSAMRTEMAQTQADATKTMIEALRSSNKPLLSSVQDIVAIMGVFNGKKSDPIEEYLKLRDMMDELRDADGPSMTESPLAAVLDRIAKTVLPLLVKAPAPEAPAAPIVAELPTAARAEPVALAPRPPSIEPFIPALVTGIEGGNTPEESAEAVYNTTATSPENRDAVLRLVEIGDWSLAYNHGFLSQHKEWLDKFREVLKAKFSAPAA